MFNLARIKAHFKAEIRSARQFFARKSQKELQKEADVINAPEPKTKVSRRAMARLNRQRIAEEYAKLFRKHYYGGQFSPVKPVPSQRTDFSKSAGIHRARLSGRMKTRQESRRITLKAA